MTLDALAQRAYRIRRLALRMGEVQGQGYIGQALDIADVLAVAYSHAMKLRPDDPHWEGRDRFLLSNGHYAIALYAALIEAGVIPESELETYGSDDSRLPMSGMASYTPGMEMSGGSLGQGLSIAVGHALGLKRKGSSSRVSTRCSPTASSTRAPPGRPPCRRGPLQARQPDRDGGREQPAGRRPEQQRDGFRAAGAQDAGLRLVHPAHRRQRPAGRAGRVRRRAAHTGPEPRVIVCDTKMGKGVPFLEAREKNHFIRVDRTSGSRRWPRWTKGRVDERPGQEAADHLGHDRVDRVRGAANPCGAPFGKALVELAEQRPDIVGMTADLAKYTDLHLFAQAYPERFYQMGMAEQLLFGAAGGHGQGRCLCPSRPPTRCSPRGAPTTSSTR
jgi:transketolase